MNTDRRVTGPLPLRRGTGHVAGAPTLALVALLLLVAAGAGAQTGGADAWRGDLESTLERAATTGRPVAVLVTAPAWCDPCTWLEENTLTSPQIETELREGWLTARVADTDPAWEQWGVERLPSLILLDSQGEEIGRTTGAMTADAVVQAMRSARTGRDGFEDETAAAEDGSVEGASPGESTGSVSTDERSLRGARYRLDSGTIWNDGGAQWYTEDAGLPPRLVEYDRGEAFLYLQDQTSGTILAITIMPDTDPSLWRWDQDGRSWVEIGALERLEE